MRGWQIKDGFGLEHLSLVELPEEPLGPHDVRVRLRAVSLNFRDYLMATGAYNPRQPLPLVPCSDGVGMVVEVGAQVTSVVVGDRVSPIFCQSWLAGPIPENNVATSLGGPLQGTLRESMVVPAEAVVSVPEHLSDEEAATLPCAAVTAWQALEGVRPGDVVLTQGTGGVSLFALQLAQLKGARVILTSSSDHKLERGRALGAADTVNYRTHTDWGRRVAKAGGATHVVELGGAGTLAQSLRAVRTGGTIALIGVLDGVTAEVPLTRILMHGVRVQGVFVGSRAHAVALHAALSANPTVRPVIDRVLSFEAAQEGFAQLRRGGHMGKVVIRVSS